MPRKAGPCAPSASEAEKAELEAVSRIDLTGGVQPPCRARHVLPFSRVGPAGVCFEVALFAKWGRRMRGNARKSQPEA